jgi:hypothetical protein
MAHLHTAKSLGWHFDTQDRRIWEIFVANAPLRHFKRLGACLLAGRAQLEASPQSWRFFSLKTGLVRFFHPSALSRTCLVRLHAHASRPAAYFQTCQGGLVSVACVATTAILAGPESVHNSKPSQVLAASSAHGVSIFSLAAKEHQPIPSFIHLPHVDCTSSSSSPLPLTYHRRRTHSRKRL